MDIKNTVNPVLSGHSKIDKAKISRGNGSLMKVESIAELDFNLGFFFALELVVCTVQSLYLFYLHFISGFVCTNI